MAVWQRIVVVLMLAASASADAGDRPFLATDSAAADEDDDNVWSCRAKKSGRTSVRPPALRSTYCLVAATTSCACTARRPALRICASCSAETRLLPS